MTHGWKACLSLFYLQYLYVATWVWLMFGDITVLRQLLLYIARIFLDGTMSRLHCKMPVCNKKHLSLSLFLCVHKSLALCSKTERGKKEPLDCRGVSDDCCRFQFLRDSEKEKGTVCTCLCVCVWVCVVWGFCRVGHTRVPRWCWMCVIVTQLRDMGSCGEICPQPSSCLSICWIVVAECCGWLLLPTVFYLQPILPSLFTEWPRHPLCGKCNREGRLTCNKCVALCCSFESNIKLLEFKTKSKTKTAPTE